MTQLAPVAACARTAPELASAASSASAYWNRPSLERFDSVTIALRCTLSDTSRVGSEGVESTICATCRARDARRHRAWAAARLPPKVDVAVARKGGGS